MSLLGSDQAVSQNSSIGYCQYWLIISHKQKVQRILQVAIAENKDELGDDLDGRAVHVLTLTGTHRCKIQSQNCFKALATFILL
jgi:hypothetical protein